MLMKLREQGRKYVSLDDIAARTLARDDPRLFLSRCAAPALIYENGAVYPIEIKKNGVAGQG
jgi:hypothetical protein